MWRALPLFLFLSTAAHAGEIVSEDVAETALTIYPDDLAMVTETRKLDLPAGRSTIQFAGVSDLIVPQSLILQSFTGVSLERNFDYDLLSEANLYESAAGERMRLTRIDPRSGEAIVDEAVIVSAGPDQGVIVETDAGVEALFCTSFATRAAFDGLPPGLDAKPAMRIDVEAETAGPQELVISYLTSGLGWQADYRLDLTEGADALLGWLSLENNTAKPYENASLSVIAGDVQRDWRTRGEIRNADAQRSLCWQKPVFGVSKRGIRASLAGNIPPAPAMMLESRSMTAEDQVVVTGSRRERAVEERFGDYKLYRIPESVTIAPYQDKQIAFLSEDDVATERVHAFELDWGSEGLAPVALRYDIDNAREGTLARSLPEGTVRVFAPSQLMGRVFVGSDDVENLPVDQPVEVMAGKSASVIRDVVRTKENVDGATYRIALTNATEDDVVVELRSIWTETTMRGAERMDADQKTWRVSVPRYGEAEVTAQVEY